MHISCQQFTSVKVCSLLVWPVPSVTAEDKSLHLQLLSQCAKFPCSTLTIVSMWLVRINNNYNHDDDDDGGGDDDDDDDKWPSLTCLSATSSLVATSAGFEETRLKFCVDVTVWTWMPPLTVMSFGSRSTPRVSVEAAALVVVVAATAVDFLSQDLSTIVEWWLKRLMSDALAGFKLDLKSSAPLLQ